MKILWLSHPVMAENLPAFKQDMAAKVQKKGSAFA